MKVTAILTVIGALRKKDRKNWKSEETRLYRLHYCYDWIEYLKESRKPEEACCLSDSG